MLALWITVTFGHGIPVPALISADDSPRLVPTAVAPLALFGLAFARLLALPAGLGRLGLVALVLAVAVESAVISAPVREIGRAHV